MERYSGKSVVRGIAIGRIYLYKKTDYEVTGRKVSDVDTELSHFFAAVERAKEQLDGLYSEALDKVGEDHARIFEAHRMLLEDADYLDAVQALIREKYNAVYAVDRRNLSTSNAVQTSLGFPYPAGRESGRWRWIIP